MSGVKCRLACGPADATATHCLLLEQNPDWFYLSVPAHHDSPGQRAVKRVCVLSYCYSVMSLCMLVFRFAYALNTGLLEVIVPSPDYYPNFDTLQDTFGDTMERVRQVLFVHFGLLNSFQLCCELHKNCLVQVIIYKK